MERNFDLRHAIRWLKKFQDERIKGSLTFDFAGDMSFKTEIRFSDESSRRIEVSTKKEEEKGK